MPKFSILTPVTYDVTSPDDLRMPRHEMFHRCARSIEQQSYRDFEWIIADDMSTPPVTREDLPANIPDVGIVRLPEKSGRLSGRNAAFKAAKGEWFCWLDADDEYASWYLQAMSEAIALYPEYKMFSFNHLIFHYNYEVSVRQFLNMEVQGSAPFRSGVIGAGAFVYHRSLYDELGGLPELGLWDFAKFALDEFPEIKPFYWNEQKQGYDTLGNPWGDDYYYFYKLTRKAACKYLNTAPYFVHSRWGHRWPGDPSYVVDPGKKPEFNPNNR